MESALLAVLSAGLLILAFPDFEYWFLAWFALVPLMWAVEREKALSVLLLGWLFGTVFFFGTCWWLTLRRSLRAIPAVARILVFIASDLRRLSRLSSPRSCRFCFEGFGRGRFSRRHLSGFSPSFCGIGSRGIIGMRLDIRWHLFPNGR